MAMSMSKITACEALDCSYNRSKECHALAITVGDKNHPMCDTFLKASKKGGNLDETGAVGACKVDGCKHNHSLECSAPSVKLSLHEGHADCKTFTLR